MALSVKMWIAAGVAALLLLWFFFDEAMMLWQWALLETQAWQAQFRRAVGAALQALRAEGGWQAWGALLGSGFLYGVLHAAGPGHGKAVISAFLLTQPGSYRTAVALACGSALLQGVSALLWVGVTLGGLQWLMRDAMTQAVWLVRVSDALLVAAGGFLMWRALRMGQGCCGCGHHHHHHEHSHGHAPQSGYMAAVLAVGLRPCSGALLVLALAGAWGMWGAGAAMVLAMSAGTALTVLTLALLTVFGRERLAMRLSERAGGSARFFRALAFTGGAVLCVLGILLLLGGAGDAAMFPQNRTGPA